MEIDPRHAADINSHSLKLQEEFAQHVAEVREHFESERQHHIGADGDVDKRVIFEGWAIQKIASLQLLVLNLISRVEDLERDKKPSRR